MVELESKPTCPVCGSKPADERSEDEEYPFLCPNDDCSVYNFRAERE